MSKLFHSAATLRFSGDALDPTEITRLLGAQPTVAVKLGGVWLTSSGAERIARTGSWRLKVEDRSPGDLNGQIVELFASLSPDLAVWKALSRRFNADLFCGLFLRESNEGIDITPDTLAAVGLRGLRLDMDIYGADPDE